MDSEIWDILKFPNQSQVGLAVPDSDLGISENPKVFQNPFYVLYQPKSFDFHLPVRFK